MRWKRAWLRRQQHHQMAAARRQAPRGVAAATSANWRRSRLVRKSRAAGKQRHHGALGGCRGSGGGIMAAALTRNIGGGARRQSGVARGHQRHRRQRRARLALGVSAEREKSAGRQDSGGRTHLYHRYTARRSDIRMAARRGGIISGMAARQRCRIALGCAWRGAFSSKWLLRALCMARPTHGGAPARRA